MNLMAAEKKRGLEPQWIPLRDAIDLFSHHQDYADVSEEQRGAYLRECTALREYMKTVPVSSDSMSFSSSQHFKTI